MLKLFAVFVLAVVSQASAQTIDQRIDHMVAQCEDVMAQNVCRVELDARDYPAPTILIAGVGRISTVSYLKIRGAGDEMCNVVRQVCTEGWDGSDCKAARALWRQQ